MQRKALVFLFLTGIFLVSCEWRSETNLCKEVDRWELEPVSAVVLFYHLEGDFKKDVLKGLLEDAASHELSKGFEQAHIIALYDKDFLEELSSEEGKDRFYEGVMQLGPSILTDPELSASGGAFYSKDPDEEEWNYLPKGKR